MLSFLFVLGMLQLIGSAVMFALVYSMFRHRLQRANPGPGAMREWDLLVRGSAVVALPIRGGQFSPVIAFGYAALFHYLFPLWWYRWGLPRAVALIVAPFAFTFVLTTFGVVPAIGALGSHVSADAFLIGACVQVPMRVAFGIYAGKRDIDFRRTTHFNRGWHQVGAGIKARSALEAVELYKHPQGKPQKLSLRQRLGRLPSALRRATQVRTRKGSGDTAARAQDAGPT